MGCLRNSEQGAGVSKIVTLLRCIVYAASSSGRLACRPEGGGPIFVGKCRSLRSSFSFERGSCTWCRRYAPTLTPTHEARTSQPGAWWYSLDPPLRDPDSEGRSHLLTSQRPDLGHLHRAKSVTAVLLAPGGAPGAHARSLNISNGGSRLYASTFKKARTGRRWCAGVGLML